MRFICVTFMLNIVSVLLFLAFLNIFHPVVAYLLVSLVVSLAKLNR